MASENGHRNSGVTYQIVMFHAYVCLQEGNGKIEKIETSPNKNGDTSSNKYLQVMSKIPNQKGTLTNPWKIWMLAYPSGCVKIAVEGSAML